MAEWKIYDYLDNRGVNDFASWSRTLETRDRAKLSQKLRMLEKVGSGLPPGLLAGPIKGYAHIYKMRINGQVALRPLLCKGPIHNDEEFTLLKGASEKDRKLVPLGAPDIAVTRREEILKDSKRRCDHARVD